MLRAEGRPGEDVLHGVDHGLRLVERDAVARVGDRTRRIVAVCFVDFCARVVDWFETHMPA